MKKTYKNLTPHNINITTASGSMVEIEPCGVVARVALRDELVYEDDEGVRFYRTKYGEVTDLPPYEEGTILIVSLMVAQAVSREDLVSPGELVRDEQGRPIGCLGLRLSQ